MILYALTTLLAASALCFGLSRALPARLLGVGAALGCLGAAALALTAMPGDPGGSIEVLTLGGASFSLEPRLSVAGRGPVAALLVGGGAALLALAGAIGGQVRGFGALFGWSLLCLAAALLSLAAPPFSLFHPLAWAVLTIAGTAALRASGAESAADTPALGLVFGMAASALLTAALLGIGPALVTGAPEAGPAIVGLVAALALAGCPPLLPARTDAAQGPAPLGALIFGLCGPAAGLGWLLRATSALPAMPERWAVTLGLVGGLGALACGAGALGERRLRPLLAWSAAAQASLVVAAVGIVGPLAALAGPGLLTAMMLGTVACAVAALSFERATGDDDYAASGVAPRAAVVVWAAGAAASLGLPPLWGFWGRLWLLEATLEHMPWLLAPLLAGSVLLALALLAAAAGLWPGGPAARGTRAWEVWAPAGIVLLPLLALGAWPALAWEHWLRAVAFAPPGAPIEPAALAAALGGGTLLAGAAALMARLPPARSVDRDRDETAVLMAPEALGAALGPLAWLAGPRPLLRTTWDLLERSSEGLRFLMGVFEQRYYLLGVLAALITIMLLMAQ